MAAAQIPLRAEEKQLSSQVGFKEARERRDNARKLLASGVDPGEHRKAQKQTRIDDASNSFKVIAREWFAKYGTTWAATHSERTMRRRAAATFPWFLRYRTSTDPNSQRSRLEPLSESGLAVSAE